MLQLRKTQELAIRNFAARLLAGNRNYSKDYASSSDDEKEHKKSKVTKEKTEKSLAAKEAQQNESASTKLNRLLASMQTADDQMNLGKRSDVVARPGEANKMKKIQQKQQAESKDIFAAARKVASMLGNDEKQQHQTESELLSKLLGGKQSSPAQNAEDLKTSAVSNENDVSLSELIVGMKIDRRQLQKEPTTTRSDYVRRSIQAKGKQQYNRQQDYNNERRPIQRKREAEVYTGSVNLFGGTPLGIFNDPSTLKYSLDLLPTWSHLQQQALKVQVSHPPSNYFDKLALWTDQGKIWRFPIDNEQDWLDEQDVDFSEHIFLEQHLEGWCPNRGPVRHFMELVCVGLSKNPYITAKEKKDHIMWYREYFESKKDILKELMAKDPKEKVIAAEQKQVEA